MLGVLKIQSRILSGAEKLTWSDKKPLIFDLESLCASIAQLLCGHRG